MRPEIVIVIGVIVIVALIAAAIGVLLWRRRESQALRKRYGSEYDHVAERAGSRREAERELHAREERHQQLDIRPLPHDTRERYAAEWRDAQRRFVDEPDAAVREAHTIVTNVMRDRGYPMADFEQRAADISVDHPHVVEDYRAANRIAEDNERGDAPTEDLRLAMVHFRSLFDRLLETATDADQEVG